MDNCCLLSLSYFVGFPKPSSYLPKIGLLCIMDFAAFFVACSFALWTATSLSITMCLCTKELYVQRELNIPLASLPSPDTEWPWHPDCRRVGEDGSQITRCESQLWNSCGSGQPREEPELQHLRLVGCILRAEPTVSANPCVHEWNTRNGSWKQHCWIIHK